MLSPTITTAPLSRRRGREHLLLRTHWRIILPALPQPQQELRIPTDPLPRVSETFPAFPFVSLRFLHYTSKTRRLEYEGTQAVAQETGRRPPGGTGILFRLAVGRDAGIAVDTFNPSSGAVDILIAEDDAPLRTGLRLLLENQGYRCAEATNGREAVDLACPRPRKCSIGSRPTAFPRPN